MTSLANALGKGMLIAAWVLVLGLLTWAFSGGFSSRDPVSSREAGRVTVVLQRDRSGHYLARGEINGQPVQFLLDTGATWVSIPQKVADRLGLKRGPRFSVETAGGTMTSYATRLERVRLGEIELENIGAGINPHVEDEEVLLGMSFLRDLEFTQRGDQLILRYP